MSIVQQFGGENVGPAEASVLGARFGVARAAVNPTQGSECGWPGTADVAKTIGSKYLVLVAEAVVQPQVEGILRISMFRIGGEVISQTWEVGRRVEIDDVGTYLVDQAGRNNIWLTARGELVANTNRGSVRAVKSICAEGIENCARVKGKIAGSGVGTGRKSLAGQKFPEIAGTLGGSGHRGQKRQSLTKTSARVVTKNKGLVFLDGTAQEETELVPLKRRLLLVCAVEIVTCV